MKRGLSILTLALAAQAGAVALSGTVEGNAAPGTRISAWAVTPFGQPVQELSSVAVTGGRFSLTLPDTTPPARALTSVDERLTWPGLMDFQGASTPNQAAPAQAAEVKFFVYHDDNGSGTRQGSEELREVRPNPGKGQLFVVWVSNPVTVTGSRDYRADLQKGWNVLVVEVHNSISVKPLDSKTILKISLGQ